MAKEDELGAMWIKSGQRGEYMTGKVKVFSPETGKLEDISIVMFRNDKKKNPKEPDWRILKSKQQDGSAPLARADGRRNEQDLRAGRPEDLTPPDSSDAPF